jgi:uncharacterized protein
VQVDISSIRYKVGSSLKVNIADDWPPLNWDGEKLVFAEPVRVDLELTNTGELLLAQGQIKAVLTVPCSRCLEVIDLTLNVPFTMGYREMGRQEETDEAEDKIQIGFQSFSGDELDLAPDIKDTIWLALPMKPLCSTDCKGLCCSCGQNLNIGSCTCHEEKIDPRLAVLSDFIKN